MIQTSMNFTTLKFEKKGNIAHITFNRSEIHNAIDSTVITEVSEIFGTISKDGSVRAIVLTGAGKSFCAGADLNWMKSFKDQGYDSNLKESLALADMFHQINTCPLPVIGRINGAAYGGGAGFVAVCDIAIAAKSAAFSFSEVKIGLAPAVISPFVIRKIGEAKAREYFITGARISAEKALQAGLINHAVDDDQLDKAVEKTIESILTSGPKAVATAKKIINEVSSMPSEKILQYTADAIARLRVSDEGQEGISAFLEKRKPKWTK